MITVIHGGQSGVDRGAHEGALANGWGLGGYMPRDGRDERGPIPQDVAKHLIPHDKPGLAARTAANVRSCTALLVIVQDLNDPRATPGTATTLELASGRRLRSLVVDPSYDPFLIARWIRKICQEATPYPTLPLQLDERGETPFLLPRVLVAGPRESKWATGRSAAATLLHHVGRALDLTLS